jgi:hypothetical protein
VVARVVYLGGPIDGTDAAEQDWREVVKEALELEDVGYYDPLAANIGEIDPLVIVRRNMEALDTCGMALFCFPTPGQFGFGSPVELWQVSREKPTVVALLPRPIYPPELSALVMQRPPVYLQYLELMSDTKVVHSLSAAISVTRDLIYANTNSTPDGA